MTKFFLLTLTIAAAFGLMIPVFAQEECREENYILTSLSAREEMMLQCLPELKLPAGYENRELPYMVDNSTQPYMRPVFQQSGLCCGQASSIGYNFTYEMSRERNLAANQVQNQYPTHFAWNFMNGGEGWYGSSYLHSMQILKEYGMPNVVDYGGSLAYGGPKRWMSGYDQYYNGMHNRINNAYQIQAGTPEGLLVLKHWLHSHLEDSPVGGIASFYAQHMSAVSTLPAGTPEAGKYVLTTFGGSPNHAMTIVGYNDSIRWDYNSDGQYTNNIDINGDNVVNMKDWEIGGFKMVQSYGGVPNWGNQGYAYMMYKTIADNLGSGGIWNHCVHVLDCKAVCDPKLTAKVILTHDRRKAVKVIAGLANSAGQTEPEYIMGFPIFDFHGGENYMQGGLEDEANKTIEFGLDLSKLLSHVEFNHPVKLFLQVVEYDTASAYTGSVVHFSIFDHTAGGTQVVSSQANVPLVNNDTTTVSLVHVFNFDRVEILDETLPPAPPGEFYSVQLNAGGGTPPYIWEFDKMYAESEQISAFPMITTHQLTPSNSSSGYVTQPIEFEFPFYDSSYSSITLHVDGYLMFDQQLYPFPYYDDDKVLFYITRHISPCLNRHQETSGGGGIWYEGDEESATFRWRTRITEDPTKILNYAVRLFPDGTIKFYYGSMNGLDLFTWLAGISDGDNFNWQTTENSFRPVLTTNSSVTLLPYQYPPEMELSDDGLFSGTPQQPYSNEEIKFKVTDNNFIFTKKTMTFTSTGVIVNDSVVSGGDPVIAFGETAWMNMSVFNVRTDTLNDATMTIHIDDPYMTVADSTESLGDVPPGQLRRYANAFQFSVATDVPNDHLITIEARINSGDDEYQSNFYHHAYAPVITSEEVVVNDQNERLDAGDITDITVSLLNSGGVQVINLYAILSTEDPSITINQNFGAISLLLPGNTAGATYNLSVDSNCPPGHTIDFFLDMTGYGGYSVSDTFSMVTGQFREDFESGDMKLFTWGSDGNKNWKIDTNGPFEGYYSAKSGAITHNEESVMKIDMNVLFDGEISFYQRTSCEGDTSSVNNDDYLCFIIDGTEMGRWDGETSWSFVQFPVNAGIHRFEWIYHKDNSTSYRFDAAWVDFITFSSAVCVSPNLLASPLSLDLLMRTDETDSVMILLSNIVPGSLNYTVDICGIEPSGDWQPAGRNIEGSYLESNAGKFNTENEYSWNFRTYNAGNDNEWIQQIYITFPPGVILVAANDFTGGSGGPMVFQGPFGNGVTAHWYGEDANGWGMVHMGEMAQCDVSFVTQAGIQGDLIIDYEVDGEVYGELPHVVYGSIPLRNLGPVVHWLNTGNNSGNLPGVTTDSLMVYINTMGMDDGKYMAWILLSDNFGHETTIPVNLIIDTYMGNSVSSSNDFVGELKAFPNPFTDATSITVLLPQKSAIRIEITNLQGQLVRVIQSEVESGISRQVSWDGTDLNGDIVPSGIYLARLVAHDQSDFVKLIRTK